MRNRVQRVKIDRIVFTDPGMTPARAEHARRLVVSAVRGLLAQQTLPEAAAPNDAGQEAPSDRPQSEAGLANRIAHSIAGAVRDAHRSHGDSTDTVSIFERRPRRTEMSSLLRSSKPGRTALRPGRVAGPLAEGQRAIGNQAMQRFSESCPLRLPSPSVCPFGGACHSCRAPVQAKLKIGQPGDRYEQEADRVADEVMRMPEPRLQRQVEPEEDEEEEVLQPKPLASEITPLVQRQADLDEEEEEEEEVLQGKRGSGHTGQIDQGLHRHINAVRASGGPPLPGPVRRFFEPRLGRDLSRVRFHTDARAAQSAEAVKARAYTVGGHVVFGAGQYAPRTDTGRRLLAHELAHVAQHSGDSHTVRCWGPSDHKEITLDAARGLIDGDLAFHIAGYAIAMDFDLVRGIIPNVRAKMQMPKGAGPDHGEDGNYEHENIRAAREQNVAQQRKYLNTAAGVKSELDPSAPGIRTSTSSLGTCTVPWAATPPTHIACPLAAK